MTKFLKRKINIPDGFGSHVFSFTPSAFILCFVHFGNELYTVTALILFILALALISTNLESYVSV